MTNESPDPAFERLLRHLSSTRGFDFTAYKRSSLMRRVRLRMQGLGIEDFASYLDHLEVDADEFARLFDAILINVTSFFRDPPAWNYVEREVVPRMLARKPNGEPLRVWSAGCASGEEAYTLAMICADRLGLPESSGRLKIYATDVDEEALTLARAATYSAKALEAVPEH